MDINERIARLERELADLKARTWHSKEKSRRETGMPVIVVERYADLERLRESLDPPCMGLVTTESVTITRPRYDENGVPTPYEEQQDRQCARYFILTYPPAPMPVKFRQPVQTNDGIENTDYGVMGIYQPSAGLAGSIVYFDQDVPYAESMFSVGVPAGNNLWRVEDVQTYAIGAKEYVKSVRVGYANGIKVDETMWLELPYLSPFGSALEDRYKAITEWLIKRKSITNEELLAAQQEFFHTSFDPTFELPVYDPLEENDQ